MYLVIHFVWKKSSSKVRTHFWMAAQKGKKLERLITRISIVEICGWTSWCRTKETCMSHKYKHTHHGRGAEHPEWTKWLSHWHQPGFHLQHPDLGWWAHEQSGLESRDGGHTRAQHESLPPRHPCFALFWLGHAGLASACRVLAPQPGMRPHAPCSERGVITSEPPGSSFCSPFNSSWHFIFHLCFTLLPVTAHDHPQWAAGGDLSQVEAFHSVSLPMRKHPCKGTADTPFTPAGAQGFIWKEKDVIRIFTAGRTFCF